MRAMTKRLFVFGQLSFFHFAIEILGNGLKPAIEKALLDIAQNHAIAAAREMCAMPLPMVPAPSTPTVLIVSIVIAALMINEENLRKK